MPEGLYYTETELPEAYRYFSKKIPATDLSA